MVHRDWNRNSNNNSFGLLSSSPSKSFLTKGVRLMLTGEKLKSPRRCCAQSSLLETVFTNYIELISIFDRIQLRIEPSNRWLFDLKRAPVPLLTAFSNILSAKRRLTD